MNQAYTQVHTISPTVDTSIYADGDNIGGQEYEMPYVVNTGDGGTIHTITVQDYDSQTPDLAIVFFNAEPSNTTFTDNGALTIADADLAAYVGHVTIASTDYLSFVNNSVGVKANVGLAYDAPNESLWVVLVSKGTPTFTNANYLKIRIAVRLD